MLVKMTEKTLNALKGWPNQAAVDFHTEFDAGVFDILDSVPPGSVVHLNDEGKYELGVGTLSVMPLFTFFDSHDPTVINDGGDPATDKGAWIGMTPTGQALSLVASGAYELVSTAFVDGTYDPNDPLTSPIAGANAGKLQGGTLYTDMIVGLVSRGIVDNGYGHDALAFWPFPVFPSA